MKINLSEGEKTEYTDYMNDETLKPQISLHDKKFLTCRNQKD